MLEEWRDKILILLHLPHHRNNPMLIKLAIIGGRCYTKDKEGSGKGARKKRMNSPSPSSLRAVSKVYDVNDKLGANAG